MNIFKSKTVSAATVVTIIGAIQSFTPVLQEFMTEQAYGYLLMALGVLFAGLRAATQLPLSEKVRTVTDAVIEVIEDHEARKAAEEKQKETA